jgi:hypothetical protein
MTLVFYWNPSAPTSRKAALTRGEVKAVFDADRVRHLASAAGGDTWWIERKGKQSVVKVPTSDYKLSWVDREVEGLKRGACDNLVRVESVVRSANSFAGCCPASPRFMGGRPSTAT